MTLRRLVLALGLGGAGWLWLQTPAGPVAAAAPEPRPARVARAPAPELSGLLPRAQLMASSASPRRSHDLFAAQLEPVPVATAAPVPEPAPAPPPTAPALPFTYLGKKIEAGQCEVFLVQGEQALVVREGSLIDSRYRIDAIAPPELRLTYLPLGETQVLAIGGQP